MRGPRTPYLTVFHYLPKNLPWSQVAQESQTQTLSGGVKCREVGSGGECVRVESLTSSLKAFKIDV